jgi:hypothetical protein
MQLQAKMHRKTPRQKNPTMYSRKMPIYWHTEKGSSPLQFSHDTIFTYRTWKKCDCGNMTHQNPFPSPPHPQQHTIYCNYHMHTRHHRNTENNTIVSDIIDKLEFSTNSAVTTSCERNFHLVYHCLIV